MLLPPPPCISYTLVQATVGVGTVIIVCVINYIQNVVRPHKTWEWPMSSMGSRILQGTTCKAISFPRI